MMGKLRQGTEQGLRVLRLEPPRPPLPGRGMKMEGSLRDREGAGIATLRPSKPSEPGGSWLNSFSVTSSVISSDSPVTTSHPTVLSLSYPNEDPNRVTGGSFLWGIWAPSASLCFGLEGHPEPMSPAPEPILTPGLLTTTSCQSSAPAPALLANKESRRVAHFPGGSHRLVRLKNPASESCVT